MPKALPSERQGELRMFKNSKFEIVAGVDGCKDGWFCITKDLNTGDIKSAVYKDAKSLLEQKPTPLIIAIDIPIGLTEAGPRICDIEARKLIGPRRSSVFPAPIRPILQANTRQEADLIGRKVDGRGVSAQAFAIYNKIRNIDNILVERPGLQERIKEVHPEVCFWAWNLKECMPYPKKTQKGQSQRRVLINKVFGGEIVEEIRAEYLKKTVATDDIHDAFAALWTAERIFRGKAEVIPNPSLKDAQGLHMEMWC